MARKQAHQPKSGRDFEQLVGWIQESVHKNAQITVNDKIQDVDTGKKRQIDIAIRLSDGPTQFLGIVEVRDRNRPIGVRYVEELQSKKRSVRADAVFLVSRSGFCKTAILKAEKLGIRTFTYEEAKEADWSGWLQCRTLGVAHRRYEIATLCFFNAETGRIIDMAPESVAEFEKSKSAKVIYDEHQSPLVSIPDLVGKVVNHLSDKIYDDLNIHGKRQKRRLQFQGGFDPPIWVRTASDSWYKVGKVEIAGEFYYECCHHPLKLMRYRATESDESIAEVAISEVEISGRKMRIELLAPGAGDCIPAGARVSMRMAA